MKDVWVRLGTGIVFIIVIMACIYISPYTLIAVFGLVNIMGLFEFQNMTATSPNNIPNRTWTEKLFTLSIGTAVYLLLSLFGADVINADWLQLIIPLQLLFFIKALRTNPPNQLGRIGINTLGILWISVPLSISSFIVHVNGSFQPFSLIAIMIFIWAQDSGAYFFGNIFGKTKMSPTISPNKTWEGTIGGVLSAQLMAFYASMLLPYFSLVEWGMIALVASVFGILGDLIESMFKRQMDVKDTGTLFPGHGGILDRFDAVIFAMPFVYLIMSFLD